MLTVQALTRSYMYIFLPWICHLRTQEYRKRQSNTAQLGSQGNNFLMYWGSTRHLRRRDTRYTCTCTCICTCTCTVHCAYYICTCTCTLYKCTCTRNTNPTIKTTYTTDWYENCGICVFFSLCMHRQMYQSLTQVRSKRLLTN